MNRIKCFFGLHSPKEIGRAIYPFEANKTIIGMGCRYCGKKLSQGYLVDTDKLELKDAKDYLGKIAAIINESEDFPYPTDRTPAREIMLRQMNQKKRL